MDSGGDDNQRDVKAQQRTRWDVWTDRDGEPLDTVDKVVAHLAAADAAAAAHDD